MASGYTGRMPTYEYPRPALSADVVVFVRSSDGDRVLLVRRGAEPFLGQWALPGGFVDEGEPLERAARRELEEETGLVLSAPLVQIGTFGDPGRDPRGWTASATYGVVIDGEPPAVLGGDDAADAAWHRLDALPRLGFDHALIVRTTRERFGL